MSDYDVIVIGGGPAGLIAAGRAAELGQKVLVAEKMEQPGRKLLITGKGRCNVTNSCSPNEFIKHVFPNGRFLKSAFSQYYNTDIVELLESHGVPLTLERGGRYFPTSQKADDVLNALLKWTKSKGVKITCNAEVKKIISDNNAVTGVVINDNTILASKVIIATGGKSYPATGSTGDGYKLAEKAGHKIVPAKPALVSLVTKGEEAKSLQGLNLKNVTASVWVDNKKISSQMGEMIFTHFGLSGPIILTLSRIAVNGIDNKSNVEISLDLKPALDEQKLDLRLQRELNEHGKKKIFNVIKLLLPSSMVPVFIKHTGIDTEKECHQISAKERKKIGHTLKNWHFTIENYRSFKEAIITAGGIPTNEISGKTMESKILPGLFFAGEVIDLDAETGGYNLQIAYSTGWAAGSVH